MAIDTPAPTRQGSVNALDLGDVSVHTYTAPDDGFNVNTTIFELDDRLVVVDAQLVRMFAAEAADLIKELGKPVDRFILTHNHADHYSGFATLTERFPGVQVAALPSVRDWIGKYADGALAKRRELFGDHFGAPVVPDALLVPGYVDIAGVRFEFAEVRDAESEFATTIALPEHEAIAVVDLVGEPQRHLFTTRGNFDNWIAELERLRRRTAEEGYRHLLIGHGGPAGPEVVPSAIAYLSAAKEAFANSTTPEEYRAEVTRLMPERVPESYLEWSSMQLFGIVAK